MSRRQDIRKNENRIEFQGDRTSEAAKKMKI
jgi:hypothetical protein